MEFRLPYTNAKPSLGTGRAARLLAFRGQLGANSANQSPESRPGTAGNAGGRAKMMLLERTILPPPVTVRSAPARIAPMAKVAIPISRLKMLRCTVSLLQFPRIRFP